MASHWRRDVLTNGQREQTRAQWCLVPALAIGKVKERVSARSCLVLGCETGEQRQERREELVREIKR